MPRKSSESDKKHGDKLESLVQRTAEGQREIEDDDDPTLLQDDDDESADNDDADERRDAPN